MHDEWEKSIPLKEPVLPFGKPLAKDAIRTKLAAGEEKLYVCSITTADFKGHIFVITMGLLSWYIMQGEMNRLVFGKCIFFFGLFLFLMASLTRLCERYILTNKRVIVERGWLTKTTEEMPYDRIESVSLEQGFRGQRLKYGIVYINGLSGHQIKLVAIENAPYFVEQLNQLRHSAS